MVAWQQRFAQASTRSRGSAIREIFKAARHPDMISFAGGLPAPEAFPLEACEQAAIRVFREQSTAALQYGATEGYPPLREWIAAHGQGDEAHNVALEPDNVLVVSGSQQALALVGQLLINPGDNVAIEQPSYLGAMRAWDVCGARYVSVPWLEPKPAQGQPGQPVQGFGLDPEALQQALLTAPKFLYTMPTFQNPSGLSMDMAARQTLLQQAVHYGVPLVEDDAYGSLRYEGEALPSLQQLEPAQVIRIATFSKVLAPGIRLAWIIAPKEVIHKLVQLKQAADLQSSGLSQVLAHELLSSGMLPGHIAHLQNIYRERRDTMLAAIRRHLPNHVQPQVPQGGMFLWLNLGAEINSYALAERAIAQGVAFVPGEAFDAYSQPSGCLRLSFSHASPEKIQEGIARLGKVIAEVSQPSLAL